MARRRSGSSDPAATLQTALELARRTTADVLDPREVLRVADRLGIQVLLIGGHAVSVLTGIPRATVDVDMVVEESEAERFARRLAIEWPGLALSDFRPLGGMNLRLGLPGMDHDRAADRADVIIARDAFQVAFATSHRSRIGGVPFRLPTWESLIALKLVAAQSPWREAHDREQDHADASRLVQAAGAADHRWKESAIGAVAEATGGVFLALDVRRAFRRLLRDAMAGGQRRGRS